MYKFMESQEVLDTLGVSNGSVGESENSDVDFLDEFDSCLKDVNDRLIVSRMVSEAVNRGIVCAVEQEAAEKLADKELELEKLKGFLHFPYVFVNEIEFQKPESIDKRQHLGSLDGYVELNKMREMLGSFRYAAGGQLGRLKKEIDGLRGCNSIKKINSVPELVGLGGILNEKENESWVGVDRTIDSLGMTLDSIIRHVDDIHNFSKITSSGLQQEQEFQREVEAMVTRTTIGSLQKEFEKKLWDQDAKLRQSQSVEFLEKFNEISNLRKELEVILKLLGSHENGPLVSYGSSDVEHSHRNGLNSHISFQTPHLEGNGNIDDPKTDVTELFDPSKFKHMSRDELEKHFTAMMTRSKREHESVVQRMTEKYISLKGKYLKESLPIKKDKEFDILKRKIPEVILKLDNVIVDNEKLPALCDNIVSSLKDRLDNLVFENRQLRDLLTDKDNEVNCLSSQVSDAAEKMLQHSLTEKNLSSLVANVNFLMEDASIETFIVEEVYKCVLGELSCHITCDSEELERNSVIRGAAKGSKLINNQSLIEDSDVELLIMQQTCEVILRESIKDATGQLKELHHENLIEKNNRVSLEMEVSKLEKNLGLKVVEIEKLQQEALSMTALIEEKDILTEKVSSTLMKKNEQFEVCSQDLSDLREYTKQQHLELDRVRGELKKALEQIEANQIEINNLNKHLELQFRKLNEADQLKKIHVSLSKARQNDLSLFEAIQRKQMEAILHFANAMSEQFTRLKFKVDNDISSNNSRLICSRSHLNSLTEKARILTKVELQYKQKLQNRCSDLQMAEAEVDLLGDEVEKLLDLLEKIYIALDHYSPILQHYPGIIEILKMVRRELSGETSKSV